MHDKARKILAMLAIAVMAVLSLSTPASAAASDCPNGKFCTWNNANYSGTRWEWSPGTIRSLPNGCLNVTASANNNQSSMYMRTGLINTVFRLHDGPNCTGASITVASSYMDADLQNHPGVVAWGDLMTSMSARSS